MSVCNDQVKQFASALARMENAHESLKHAQNQLRAEWQQADLNASEAKVRFLYYYFDSYILTKSPITFYAATKYVYIQTTRKKVKISERIRGKNMYAKKRKMPLIFPRTYIMSASTRN